MSFDPNIAHPELQVRRIGVALHVTDVESVGKFQESPHPVAPGRIVEELQEGRSFALRRPADRLRLLTWASSLASKG